MPPKPRVTVVLDPDDRPEHARFLHSLGDVLEGRIVCEFLPGRRTKARLAETVLTGLGKDLTLTGTARNAEEQWRRVEAWVAGEQPNVLVLWRAQNLPRSHWEKLMDLPLDESACLYLVVQGTATSRGQREAIRDHGLEVVSFLDFQGRFTDVSVPGTPGPTGAVDFPTVPSDEFPAFLAACRSVLSDEDFAMVEARYWAAYEAGLALVREESGLAAVEKKLGAFVRDLLRDAPTLDEMLVMLRGAQAALFLRRYLLGIDRESLAAGYAAIPRPRLDEATARRLRRLAHPRLAALAVLALAVAPNPAPLSDLDVGDIAVDGDSAPVGDEHVDLPSAARGLVRAQLAHRRLQGAGRADPLFVSERSQAWTRSGEFVRTTPHGIQQQLRQIAEETSVPVATSEGWLRTDKRWLARRGITVREIALAA
jgi:hypothetical protein